MKPGLTAGIDPGAPANWQRVEQVLDRLLDELADSGSEPQSVSRRRLDELCGSDAALRREVALLLAEAGKQEDLFGLGLANALPDLLAELGADPSGTNAADDGQLDSTIEGRTVDRYRLLEVLGRGGMGVVYLAERADAEFEKRVALKIMPRGLESAEKERRFRTERQILARLEHENIARLLDGGVTDEGYPYLTMELVEGKPIDSYCDGDALPERERLRLFLEVCAAVRYAHENLVLHRDLKPSNILATEDGRVKLLDFGVGKILDDTDGGESTRFQPMTPEYASPEQRNNQPVSTATDVYSLGLVLRRLLCGAGPSEVTSSTSALTGDLQVILEKALRQSPERRFRSVGEMAADITRYLDGRPIESRPATLRYRFGKFVARHRLATVSALIVTFLLISAMATIVRQGRVARAERDRARVAAQKARTVADLLGELLSSADPNSPSAGQLSALALIERGETRIRTQLADQPEVRSELLTVIGYAHSNLGDNTRGAALLEEAIWEHRTLRPGDPLALADALKKLASVYHDSGELDLATTHAEEALELLQENGALDSVQGAKLLLELGRIHTVANRHEDATGLIKEALSIFERSGNRGDAALAKTDLATILGRTGRVEDAVQLNREALETLIAVHGERHPIVSDTRNNLGVNLLSLGRYEEAERLLRESVALGEELYGPDHPALANNLSNLGKLLMDEGRFGDAAPFVRRAADIRRETSAPDSYSRIAVEMNLAGLDLALGDLDAAITLYRSGVERFERLTGPRSAPSARVRSLLGIAHHRAGDEAVAERLLTEALALQGADEAPASRAETLIGLGALLSDLRRADEAEPLLRDGLALLLERLPDDHWRVDEARIELAGALLRQAPPTTEKRTETRSLLKQTQDRDFKADGFAWLRARAATFRQLEAW